MILLKVEESFIYSLMIFYQLSFIVTALSSWSLTTIGHHLFHRGQILEIFALSQFSLLGSMMSRVLFPHDYFLPLPLSLALSFIFFFIGQLFFHWLKKGKKELKQSNFNLMMVGSYLILLCLQYLLIGIFPQLDAHLSLSLFGSLVTASLTENWVMIIVFSLFLICYYTFYSRKLNQETLELSFFADATHSPKKNKFSAYYFILIIPVVTSLFGLGFINTLSFLLLPPLFLGDRFKNHRHYQFIVPLLSVISSLLGLVLSLTFERVGTVPAQVLLLGILLLTSRSILAK